MQNEKTKKYFILLNNIKKVFEILLPKESGSENIRAVCLSLAEIHSCSKQLVEIIENISQIDSELNEKNLDKILEEICYLKVILYDEMMDWVKDLKKPRKIIEDKIGDLGAELYGWE